MSNETPKWVSCKVLNGLKTESQEFYGDDCRKYSNFNDIVNDSLRLNIEKLKQAKKESGIYS